MQPAFGFGEGRRIQNDQIETLPRFLGAAHKLKDILLNPLNGEMIADRVFPGRGNALGTQLDSDDFSGSGAGTGQGEATLTREAVEDAAAGGMLCDQVIVGQLVEIKAGLLRME